MEFVSIALVLDASRWPMSDVKLYPAWKQAVQDFLMEFKYGDIVPHEWLVKQFGLPLLDERMNG